MEKKTHIYILETVLQTMKIGIDIDEVLAEFVENFLKYKNRLKGTNFKKEHVKSYEFWHTIGGTREEAMKEVNDFHESEYFDSLSAVEFSQQSLKELEKTNELHLITSRHPKIKKRTGLWLKKYFSIKFAGIHFSGDFEGKYKTKAEICEDLGIDVIVEDNLNYARNIAKKGIKVF